MNSVENADRTAKMRENLGKCFDWISSNIIPEIGDKTISLGCGRGVGSQKCAVANVCFVTTLGISISKEKGITIFFPHGDWYDFKKSADAVNGLDEHLVEDFLINWKQTKDSIIRHKDKIVSEYSIIDGFEV